MYINAIYLAALLIGVVAGLRTMTALAAVSWAAFLGALKLAGTPLAFMGYGFMPWILTIAAVAELVTDQLPSTPSRRTPVQFGARIGSGALCGAALVMTVGSWPVGLGAGIAGAILGTLLGSAVRGRMADAFRRDRPAAFIEDAVAIVGAVLVVGVLG
jgi:uncharacterized membrane protein